MKLSYHYLHSKELEKKCQEEEKTAVHEMMKAASLSPEELARLISFAKSNPPMSKPLNKITKEDVDENEE